MYPEIDKIFTPNAQSIWEFMVENGQGCYIPAYQRPYSWDEKNISRLFEDVLRGIRQISSRPDTINFIGTIIAIHDTEYQTIEPIYHTRLPQRVMTIIDGQQRICTILISNIVMHDYIRRTVKRLDRKTGTHFDWIREKCTNLLADLRNTYLIDRINRDHNYRYYPRIIRAYSDAWSYRQNEAKYDSPIAKLIWKYIDFTESGSTSQFKLDLGSNNHNKTVDKAFCFIRKEIKRICQSRPEEYDFPPVQRPFVGIQDVPFPDVVKKYIEEISDDQHYQSFCHLLRFLIFARYLNHYTATTVVTAKNEDDAFDIFEALNTTGEPLTAIETFKPRVISFERENGNTNFSRSESAIQFERLEANLNYIYPETDKRQRETKELLVTFALYLKGDKLPLNLTSQRNYLRSKFEEAANSNLKRRIVRLLADIAEFRQTYWNRDFIQTLDSIHPNDTSDWLKLCCTFISDMKTSLAIPIMARYWAQYKQDKIEDTFTEVVKALTAFLVLRRSVTGNTGRIDSDFRKMMETLCIGLDDSNSILSLDELQETLKGYLAASRIGVENKETWVSQVCEVPLADHSRPLCRFLLFAASHNARTDQENPGLLKRENVIRSDELAFLNYSKWQDDKYATVEHVAPVSKSSGWNEKIYKESDTLHTIGNIILLPQKENSSVGNAPWAKKKIFYRALVAKTEPERNSQFEQAKKDGLTFKKQTQDLLNKQGRLDMLDPIAEVSDWTESIIQKRTKNILELAWDVIAPWLDY